MNFFSYVFSFALLQCRRYWRARGRATLTEVLPPILSDGASSNTFAYGAGGMRFNSRADQISHMLPASRHRYNLEVCALVQSCGDWHRSLVTPDRVLSECNDDLIFFILLKTVAYALLITRPCNHESVRKTDYKFKQNCVQLMR